jgi:hypothetical protein
LNAINDAIFHSNTFWIFAQYFYFFIFLVPRRNRLNDHRFVSSSSTRIFVLEKFLNNRFCVGKWRQVFKVSLLWSLIPVILFWIF